VTTVGTTVLSSSDDDWHSYAPQSVQTISGKSTTVQTKAEAEFYRESQQLYLTQTKFTENTDLMDLDRLLVLELMVFRWQQHLFSGRDYEGEFVNEKQLTADIKAYSDQINKVKDSMGLSKKVRDEAQSEDNFARWLTDLKARAKIFGVHREKQLTVALTLMKELITIVGTFDRSDDEERRKIGFETEADVVEWVRNTMTKEFNALDEYFTHHEQRYWIGDMG
jgi:hypothetical protein